MSNATEKMFEVAAINAFENNALNTLTNTVNNVIVGNNRTDLSANDCSLNLLRVDTISEKTNLNGVVVEGVTLKNNGVTAGSNGTISASNFNVGSKNVISASAQGSFLDLELKHNNHVGVLAYGETGDVQMTGTLSVDTINEKTDLSGVIIEGVTLKNNGVTAGSNGTISASNFNVGNKNVISASAQGSFTDLELKNAGNTGFLADGQTGDVQMTGTLSVDTINEKTSANGVTIDGVSLKDNGITLTGDVSANRGIFSTNAAVGVSSASQKLTVQTGTDYDGIILSNEDGNLLFKAARAGSKTVGYMGLYDANSSPTPIVEFTNSGNHFIKNGNFGIGTVSPSQKLDVQGNVLVTGDMSVNRLYINSVDISGLVHSKQNTLTAGSNITIVGNTINSVAGTGPSGINQTTDVSLNNLKVHGDLSANDASFNVIDVAQINAFRMNGHILPTSNASFDLGSAEYKIRHLFLSDNSIWIGDNHKMDTVSGTIKLKKRKNLIPKKLREFSPEITIENVKETLNSNNRNINNYEDITLDDWLLYARTLGMNVNNVNDVFDNVEDFEKDVGIEQDLSGSSLNLNNVNMNNLMLKGIDNANYLNNTSDFKNISNVINNLMDHINTLTNRIQELENKI